ncbi:MAG: cupin domain-containing protein [Nitrosomonas sp.]|nr:cupin domain-containing protein [Nitrosomonas sp.]MCC7136162.1 cupin domain-containing protein [Nitrosomonas sp.]
MATHHASPAEIVDLETWAQDMPNEQTKVIVKTDEMELARLVILAGKEFPTHKVSGPIIVHCINGKIEFTAMGEIQVLMPGQLLHLMPDEPHSVKAVEDSVVLLTIIFKA